MMSAGAAGANERHQRLDDSRLARNASFAAAPSASLQLQDFYKLFDRIPPL